MIPGAKTWTLAITACLMLPFAAARAEFRKQSACALLPPSPFPDGGIETAANTAPHPIVPNLTPQAPSPAPLLRKINFTSATMIPMFYCGRVPADQAMDVDVPAFDWGVANDDRTAVNRAFSVAILNGASNNAPLATQSVQSIPRSGTRIFRNWPGRPTRVRVLNVTAANPKFGSEYDSTPGCYIPTALAGSVTLDPKSLIVRVDSDGQITERVESDNDLTR
ncbi:MAG: hypothetical protein ABI837_04520 [Acidobacteriota bacterium]